jgi:hypothetical protein
MTFSPDTGVSSSNSAARGVPLVKTGAPGGVAWTTCTMFLPFCVDLRYFSRMVEMALREALTLSVVRSPVAYSFCASMMIRVESLTDTVEAGTPISSRNDFGLPIAEFAYALVVRMYYKILRRMVGCEVYQFQYKPIYIGPVEKFGDFGID